MTMTEPIRSGSAPEGWQPPTPEELAPNPLQQTQTQTQEQSPVIDEKGARGDTPSPLQDDDVSPGQLAKMADVRPQMIYNYITQGLIECFINEQGKKRITKEVAEAWLAKYLTNKQDREEKKRAEIERQLNGIDH